MSTPLSEFIKYEISDDLPRPIVIALSRSIAQHVFNPWKYGAYSTRQSLRAILELANADSSVGNVMRIAIAVRRSYTLVEWRIRVLQKLLGTGSALSKEENAELRLFQKNPPWRGMRKRIARENVSVADMEHVAESVIRKNKSRTMSLVYSKMRFLCVAHGMSQEDFASELIMRASFDLRWVYPFSNNPGGVFWSRVKSHCFKYIASLTSVKHSKIIEDGSATATPKNTALSENIVCTNKSPDADIMLPWAGLDPKTAALAKAIAVDTIPDSLLVKMQAYLSEGCKVEDPEELFSILGKDRYYSMVRRHWRMSKPVFKLTVQRLLAIGD